MKFTVELEEFWLEGEEGIDLATALKDSLKNEILAKIRTEIKDQVSTFADKHIKSVLDAEIQARVQIVMDEIVSSGKVKGTYSSDPELTVKEWAAKKFADSRSDINRAIEKQVKSHVSELQQRYDLFFATQLIGKMKEAGFMKDDIEKLIEVSSNTDLLNS